MHLYWGVLLIAVIVEVMWALSLKAVQDHPSAFLISISIALTALNMGLLSFAMRGIPIGTAYAVWTRSWVRRDRNGRHYSLAQ